MDWLWAAIGLLKGTQSPSHVPVALGRIINTELYSQVSWILEQSAFELGGVMLRNL